MKKSEVKAIIASKKFVQSVFIRPISGIDYLVIGNTAHVVSSWQRVADQLNTLDVVPEVFKGGQLTDEELAEQPKIIIESEMPETPISKALKEAGY
jgi:hypothetical protein